MTDNPMADSGVIDQAALNDLLESTGGDPEFLGELIDAYVSDSAELLATLHRALAGGDAAGVRRAAHSLKSNSANFGARSLASQCQELEDRSKAGELEDAADRIAGIEAEYRRVERALLAVREGG
jgi:HPt (histidine-containing phosphotransfer) domain-containing protein